MSTEDSWDRIVSGLGLVGDAWYACELVRGGIEKPFDDRDCPLSVTDVGGVKFTKYDKSVVARASDLGGTAGMPLLIGAAAVSDAAEGRRGLLTDFAGGIGGSALAGGGDVGGKRE